MNGRRLASAANLRGLSVSYVYNADGLRTSKTVNGVEHKYIWQGDKLVSEAYGGRELEFFYDESGKPYAMSHRSGPNAEAKLYYYVTNLQGDVLSLVDAEGFSAAEYWYNAWGLPMGSSGAMAEVNPLRYRGYYFDQETGLYYLKSRYYDPFVCRFVNADDYASTGQGFIGTNMFAYCINNPVASKDSSGSIVELAFLPPLLPALATAIGAVALAVGIVAAATAVAVGVVYLGGRISDSISSANAQADTTLVAPMPQISHKERIYDRIESSLTKVAYFPNNRKSEAHHIVAQRAPNAAPARSVLFEVGIGINSAPNIVMVKYEVHRRLHTNVYYGWVNSMIISAYRSGGGNPFIEQDNVIQALRQISGYISALNILIP